MSKTDDIAQLPEKLLDVSGLICPMPVIKLQQLAARLSPGERIKLIATDPGVEIDIPTWCEINAHQIVDANHSSTHYMFTIVIGRQDDTH